MKIVFFMLLSMAFSGKMELDCYFTEAHSECSGKPNFSSEVQKGKLVKMGKARNVYNESVFVYAKVKCGLSGFTNVEILTAQSSDDDAKKSCEHDDQNDGECGIFNAPCPVYGCKTQGCPNILGPVLGLSIPSGICLCVLFACCLLCTPPAILLLSSTECFGYGMLIRSLSIESYLCCICEYCDKDTESEAGYATATAYNDDYSYSGTSVNTSYEPETPSSETTGIVFVAVGVVGTGE